MSFSDSPSPDLASLGHPLPKWEREQRQRFLYAGGMKSANSHHVDRARSLRKDQTPPEGILWQQLRGRRLQDLKFRRQMPLGPYTVDFCCPEAKLVVEVDSIYHSGRQEQDAARDRELESRGYRVLRVSAGDVATNLDGVLTTIVRIAAERIREAETTERK